MNVTRQYSYVRNRLNGCVTVIYRSVCTFKQARSQEVKWGGGGGGKSINTSESIYPGGQIRERAQCKKLDIQYGIYLRTRKIYA